RALRAQSARLRRVISVPLAPPQNRVSCCSSGGGSALVSWISTPSSPQRRRLPYSIALHSACTHRGGFCRFRHSSFHPPSYTKPALTPSHSTRQISPLSACSVQ